jgi:hypothetical protein
MTKELSYRETDGLQVWLLWRPGADRVHVRVEDSRSEESFELDVSGRDALDAFVHPFAYGARLGLV